MPTFDTLAGGYDLFMWPLEWALLTRLRRRAFGEIRGQVLEIGIGTGAHLPLYPSGTQVIGIDDSIEMLRVASRRPTRATVTCFLMDAHHLALADASFDQVIGALLLCNVTDPATVLTEIHRILRPGGRLVLLEHVRGPAPFLARLTDYLDYPWHALNRSCHLNRETVATVAAANFTIKRTEGHLLGLVQIIEATPQP
jgi:phosphatidylethanolamine/phosphatidyl-N-methylethanolamine N-methyltransferase